MGEERNAALAALAARVWPDGLSIDADETALRVAATPVGRVDAAVLAGIALGIPVVVVLLFPTIQGVIAAVLFAIAVVGLGYVRFTALRCVTVDVAAGRMRIQHANPRLARRLGIRPREIGFTDVTSLQVTRTMPAARTEPHGRRVSLRLDDGTRLTLAEFTDAATGLAFARAVATVLGSSIEER